MQHLCAEVHAAFLFRTGQSGLEAQTTNPHIHGFRISLVALRSVIRTHDFVLMDIKI